TKLGVPGDKMGQYTQMRTADAIGVAAANPGGLAGAGVGLGAGVAIGNAMGQSFGSPSSPSAAPPPPPAGNAARWSLAIDGKTYGPYTDDALRTMIASGQVPSTTQAWRPGCAGWASLTEFPEL